MPIQKLTSRFIETVAVTGERSDYRDTLVRGLELRVTDKGAKTWVIRYTRKSDGRRRRFTLGTFPATALDEARTRAREELAAVSRGADPAAKVQEHKEALTFREVSEEWERRHGKPNKGYRSLKDDKCMLDRHILPHVGDMRAGEVQKRDIIKMLDAVAATPDARRTSPKKAPRRTTHRANRVFELVCSIFRWALGRDLVKADPTAGVPPPIKKEKARERALSYAEIDTFWRSLDGAPAKRADYGQADFPMIKATAIALKLALVTAQRIGEVTGIDKSEYDLLSATPIWIVPGERSKNGEPNRVPLSPLAVELIREAERLSGNAPWLFPSPKLAKDGSIKGPIDAHAPTKALERARDKIGVASFRVHDLRRTAATRMAELGISPHTISLVLNHVSARKGTITSAVYVQYSYDREKREALLAWSAELETRTPRTLCEANGRLVFEMETHI